MRLKVQFYPQRTKFTCDPACLMMALKYFNPKIKLSTDLEFQIWRESYGIGILGCMPQGLAYSALIRGLTVVLICRKDSVSKISRKIATGENFDITVKTSQELLRKSKKLGMKIIDKKPLLSDVRDAIDKGGIPLIMINMKRIHGIDSPHWVTITGYDNGLFFINDPYSKKPGKIEEYQLATCMDDLGKLSGVEKRVLILSK